MTAPELNNVCFRLSAWVRITSVVVCLNALSSAVAGADNIGPRHTEEMAAGLAIFKSDVRAILLDNCVKCHGSGSVKSGFGLSTREALLIGGDHGVAVVPGNPGESRLLRMLRHEEEPHMPHKKPRLDDGAIMMIERWIQLGAPYDKPLVEGAADDRPAGAITDEDRAFWSFLPLNSALPPAKDDAGWGRNTIDRFIHAKLAESELAPNGRADRRILIRRVYYDLLGLPPTPERVDAFVADPDPDAYAKLVDQLLDNPHFGQRWARHWLDVVRFGESCGFEQDYDHHYGYHYRDFVIRAFNADMPYDTFVKWQLAGDEYEPDNPDALAATNFLTAGVFPTQLTEVEFEPARYDQLDDMAGTTGTAFLGLTVGCARCHDHKYDPIPARDYYSFAATFTTAIRTEISIDTRTGERVETPKADVGEAPPPPPEGVIRIQACSEGVKPVPHNGDGRGFPHFYPETYHLNRGDLSQKGEVAQAAFLQVLMREGKDASFWRQIPPDGSSLSYRRRSLAQWITDTEYGAGHLLARVIVNRLWQHHMGRGIVETPSDFGMQGERPTHPQLLDYLASELITSGWSLKHIHRLILNSAVYTQTTDFDEARAAIDRGNRLWWRREPRRLEAEVIRDAMLAVSGELDATPFGPGTLDESMSRRSIYFFVKRSQLIPMMVTFDAPDTLVTLADRPETTVAPQALLMLNNPIVRGYAEAMAGRVRSVTASPAGSIRRAYALALSREPTDGELHDALSFVESSTAGYRQAGQAAYAQERALADLCQSLFALNEFIYID